MRIAGTPSRGLRHGCEHDISRTDEPFALVVHLMTGPQESAWLFTRGSQSVRLVRKEQPGGSVRLLVYGPGDTESSYEFREIAECMKRQTDIEQTLLGEGYQLAARASERRGTRRVWLGPDRRRSTANEAHAS